MVALLDLLLSLDPCPLHFLNPLTSTGDLITISIRHILSGESDVPPIIITLPNQVISDFGPSPPLCLRRVVSKSYTSSKGNRGAPTIISGDQFH